MSITRTALQESVDRFLPRTTNPSRDAITGKLDPDVSFDKVLQVLLTALVLNRDAAFYIIYLSSLEYQRTVATVIADIDMLLSDDLLGDFPIAASQYKGDVTSLKAAEEDLARVSASMAAGSSNTQAIASYGDNLTDYLTTEIVPNVDGRNRISVGRDVRSYSNKLRDDWETMLSQLERLLATLDEFTSSGVKKALSTSVITTVRATTKYYRTAYPELSGVQQGNAAERVLLDLAASKAVLEKVTQPPIIKGTIISSGADGSTPASYLAAAGSVRTLPFASVDEGVSGTLTPEVILSSRTGSLVSGSGGATFNDFAGDFITNGVLTNDYLYIVQTGISAPYAKLGSLHRVVSVSGSSLTISPAADETYDSNLHYFISRYAPGAYFGDADKSWFTEYNAGVSGTVILASGTGALVRTDKASGTAGTNSKANGTAGVATPVLASGATAGIFGSSGVITFTGENLLSAGIDVTRHRIFITDGAAPLPNRQTNGHEILTVDTDNQVTVNTLLAFDISLRTWEIRDPNEFYHLTATFFTDGIEAGDRVNLDDGNTGTYDGIDYTVVSVLSETQLSVTDGGTTFDAGYDFSYIYDVFFGDENLYDASAEFLSDGVAAGDVVEIAAVGTYNVATVPVQEELTHDGTVTAAFYSTTWAVYELGADVTTSQFYQLAEDFTVLLDGRLANGEQAYLEVLGGTYEVESVLDANNLLFDGDVAVTATVAYTLTFGLTTRSLTSVGTPFASSLAGDVIVLWPGTPEAVTTYIETVVSDTEVLLATDIAPDTPGITFWVSGVVQPGAEVLVSNRRVAVLEILSPTLLRLDPPLPASMNTLQDYQIVNKGTSRTTSRIKDDSASPPFTSALIGKRIQITGVRPQVGTIRDVPDGTTLDISIPLPFGQQGIPYQILEYNENLSDTVTTAEASASGVAEGDYLALWGLEELPVVQANTGTYDLEVRPLLPARETALAFYATRGGSPFYPRYLLFVDQLNALTLSEDTDDYRRRAGSALIAFTETSAVNAIAELDVLRAEAVALQEVLAEYFVPEIDSVSQAVGVMRDQNMDRALSLLLAGRISEFAELEATGASFAGHARGLLQAAGPKSSLVAGQDNLTALQNESAVTPSNRANVTSESSATRSIATAVAALRSSDRVRSEFSAGLDDSIATAVYELTGEIQAGLTTDRAQTLPWLAVTGTKRDRVREIAEEALSTLRYILNNPDEFEVDL